MVLYVLKFADIHILGCKITTVGDRKMFFYVDDSKWMIVWIIMFMWLCWECHSIADKCKPGSPCRCIVGWSKAPWTKCRASLREDCGKPGQEALTAAGICCWEQEVEVRLRCDTGVQSEFVCVRVNQAIPWGYGVWYEKKCVINC